MPISSKRKLVVGAASLAVLAGTGGAYAAAQTGTPTPAPTAQGKQATPAKPARPADIEAEKNAFLDDVAKRLNVPRERLDSALKGAAEARVDAAVAAGRITKQQGEEIKARIADGGPLLGLGGPGPLAGKPGRGFGQDRGPGHGPGRGGPLFGSVEDAASYLGLSGEQLREQLHDGKSLAEIAKAQGKSADGLKATLKDALSKRLDEAAKDGRLSATDKQRILSEADKRLGDVINGKFPPRPRHP
jgi:hypothetical protein